MTDGQIQTLTYKIENNQINIQIMTDGQIQTLTYKIERNQINKQEIILYLVGQCLYLSVRPS
jgi:hypothetical protein